MSATEFWAWFEVNNTKYLFLNEMEEADKKRELQELLDCLHKFCDKLFYEIGHHPDNADQEFIITANGDINYFEKVEELIAVAPEIKNWKLLAFKPPIGFEFSIDYNGLRFNPSETWFQPLELESRPLDLGIRICFSNYSEDREEDFINGSFLMLDASLGEKSTATDINYLEVSQLPTDPVAEGMLPLSQLPEYIEWLKNQRIQNN